MSEKNEFEKLYDTLKEKYQADESVRDAVNVGSGAAAIALVLGLVDAVSPSGKQTVGSALATAAMAAAMVGGGVYGAAKLKDGSQPKEEPQKQLEAEKPPEEAPETEAEPVEEA